MAMAGCAGSSGRSSDDSSSGTGASPAPTGAKLSTWSAKPKAAIDSFSWALSGEPSTFDWTKDNSSHSGRVLPNVVERLFFKDPDGGRSPGLAVKLRTPSPRTIDVKLRRHVRFHDGSAMTARDVVASLDRSRAKGSVWSYALRSIDDVTARGPYRVRISLSRPDSLVGSYLSTAAGTVESASFLKKAGDKYGSAPQYLDGTGAFTMTRWTRGTEIDLRRAPNYWGTPALARHVQMKIIEDSETRDQALASGEIDGSSAVGSGSAPEIKSPGGHMYYGAGTSTWSVALFNSHGVLGDPRVRRALSLAINRAGLVAAASNGTAVPAGDFAAPGLWPRGSDRLPPLRKDTAKATKLIDAAGAQGKKLVLSYSAQSSTVTPMATAVRAAGQSIGLNIQLKEVSTAVTNAFVSDPKSRRGTDLSLAMIGSQSGDPLEVYREFTPGGFLNFAGYSNAKLNALVKSAARSESGAKRIAALKKARGILLHDMPWIPLISSPVAVYFGKRVTGGPTNAAGTQNFPWAKYVGGR
ncbi:ABC transporter substrate-binding protein [Spelaeicoccus albus]